MADIKTLGSDDLVKDSRQDINDNFNAINTELGDHSHTDDHYTKAESDLALTGKAKSVHRHAASNITQNASNRFVTDSEKSTWNSKANSHTHPYSSSSHGHTKAAIGLGRVENKSSATIRSEITDANINASVGVSGNTIVKRHSSGYIFANYFNTTCNVQPSAPSYVMISNTDNYIRKQTPAKLKAHMGIKSNADRNCTISTANPSGGSNGDVWYRY